MPEMGKADGIGFFEDIPEKLQTMFTRGAFGKAEVIERNYKDDDRFGGVYVDKFNNPIIVWQGNPYYVNKKGLSVTDFGDFVAELTKFAPATKIMTAVKSLGLKIPTGLLTYGGTELGAKGLDMFLAPETAERNAQTTGETLKDIGFVGGVSTATDILLPPTFALLGRAVKSGTTAGLNVAKSIFPQYKPGIEKTLGQTILKEADIVGEEVAKEDIPLVLAQTY